MRCQQQNANMDIKYSDASASPIAHHHSAISRCFLDPAANLAASMLAPETLRAYGYFDPGPAEKLIVKAKKNAEGQISARDDMAMVAMVSTQLLHHHFLAAA